MTLLIMGYLIIGAGIAWEVDGFGNKVVALFLWLPKILFALGRELGR